MIQPSPLMQERRFQHTRRRQSKKPGWTSRLLSILASVLGAGLALSLGLTGVTADASQAQTGTLRVEVMAAGIPIAGATVSAGGEPAATDASGVATLALSPGPVSVIATKDAYEPATGRVDVVADAERVVRLLLTARPTAQSQATVVASTRTGVPIEDQAVPVEVLERDEIVKNMLMTPGNILRSLDEIGGLRVQTTSPELGLAMVRIHGLRGQYTRLISDGVPLYFDLPGGLAPVQIPPMDLERVEVITGGASALFGANATAGVINLLSRRPGKEANREFSSSQSMTDATDGVLWISSPSTGSWSGTTLVSAHRQSRRDLDDDGWSDIPGYSRGVARQRLFWDNGRGRSVSGTAGVTFEKREGGSAIAHQDLETKIADGALFGQMTLGRFVLAGAGSLYVQSRVRDFSEGREHERRESATIEFELRGSAPRQTWVAGIGADWFANRSTLVSAYVAPRGGVFLHDDVHLAPWLTVSGSARLDYTKGAGAAIRIDDFFFSPRASVVARKGAWAAGVSADRSYFTPTPLTEETEAAGFARLSIEGPLQVEMARSVSADLSYKKRGSAVTLTVFQSHIDDPSVVNRATYTIRTAAEPFVTHGAELLGTTRRAPFTVTGTYAYVRPREEGGREVALTPRHSASLAATAEADRGRVGVQVNFTGEQRLDANPYRSRSEPYVVLSLLAEHRFGRWRVFANAENLTDVRQTRWDPIARPVRDVDGRWTVDAWAPLAGRVINIGIRASF
jgi:outer membrane receptor for ferrienterochelin and colicins